MTKLYKDLVNRLNSKGYFVFNPKESGIKVIEFIDINENVLDKEILSTGQVKISIKKSVLDLINSGQLVTA